GADPVGGLRNSRLPRRARSLGAAVSPRVPLGRPVRRRHPAWHHRLCDVSGDVAGRASSVGVAGGAALTRAFSSEGQLWLRSILRHAFRHPLKPGRTLLCPDHVSANVPHAPPGSLETESEQHLVVPHPLAALDQPEIADDAVRPAAHAGELRTLKMTAHTRHHACCMHRASILSILTATESTAPTCEAVKALRCCRARRCDAPDPSSAATTQRFDGFARRRG